MPEKEQTEHDDPLWYKDAVIYQVHVKSFFDSDNDGIGDFKGLIEKLDYIQELGVSAVWLLPFYPSPMRDDGYDISDYRNINPAYGTRRDFRAFVREAHRRGLKVITELVVNHTSDQHPWFQAARRARAGSAKRKFYIWSDTDKKFPETRIIFTDTEESNWAWDPVAQQYYWHRFFSHQPDLNHNNPRVVDAVIHVMRFWLDTGVDGMRLDAIPYLCVREGTDNENLPETHTVIRKIRAAVDAKYRNRMLLAEANQWPEDVREYFGSGDECHMAYHFPLMPRMYMAIAQEDRHPVVEIMQQTPDIPDTCQWAVFLRNHDELTLEMVTDRERDYMYQTYANDPRMRVNIGIRRRLAPLMDNEIHKIQLMNSLLLSMPGSPILYYGDELGMGDNFYLGDRNGVRTPMQWSPDRNGGFSKADPQSLFLPPIMDPVYGYESVNVEAQSRETASLLNWTKRILNVRKAHKAFGRGSLSFLRPGNRKILAYTREHDGDTLLCVANLSRSAQPVELDLSRFRGRVPVELMGRTAFPPIGELPYLLTLPGHGFYWFELAEAAQIPAWHEQHLVEQEAPWLVLFDGLASFVGPGAGTSDNGRDIAERLRRQFEQNVLPPYLGRQRWFAAKDERLVRAKLGDVSVWNSERDTWLLAFIDVELEKGAPQRYFLPLAVRWENDASAPIAAPPTLARVRQRSRTGVLYDAFANEHFCLDLLDAFAAHRSIDWADGRLEFETTTEFGRLAGERLDQQPVRRTATEGSNSTLLVGEALFVKAYRRLQPGTNPEWEMGRYLTEAAACDCIAKAAGALQYHVSDAVGATLVLVQECVANQGDGFEYTVQYLDKFLEVELTKAGDAPPAEDLHAGYLMLIGKLAQRTAELHRALARDTDEAAFAPEPMRAARLSEWGRRLRDDAALTIEQLQARRAQLSDDCQAWIDELLAGRRVLDRQIRNLVPRSVDALCTRFHGDFHLGQVLIVENDFVITDLEGEPGRSFEERRRKDTALKDVAGMLRSFRYAAGLTEMKLREHRPSDVARAATALADWSARVRDAFLDAYRDAMQGCAVYPAEADHAMRLIDLAAFEKLLYEVRYEMANRPEWLAVPLRDLVERL
jgi:maltose alpha-D-glucosyltransferase/alpha-amylase